MKRREFITLLGGATAWPLAARAQQPAMPVIGVLYGVSAAEWVDHMVAFRGGLGDTGFVEGRNLAIEYRWAEGRNERYAEIATEFARLKVDVIFMLGTLPVIAAKQTIAVIPIVFLVSDPVGSGIVTSLARPEPAT